MSFNPNIRNIYELSKEPSGFGSRATTSLSVNESTRTVTVSPTGSSFEYYVRGVKYTHTSSASVTFSDTEGVWHIYFDGYNLQSSQSNITQIITEYAYVANLYWDAINNKAIVFCEERHGLTMDGYTHMYLHNSIGATFVNGFALGNFQVDGTGAASADGYFSVANGVFYDEDIVHTIVDGAPQDISTVARLPVLYRTGSDGYWRSKAADPFPIIYSGTAGYTGASGRLPYNQWTGSAWQLAEVAENKYVLLHVFATNNISEPVIAIQGIAQYNNKTEARTGATTELASLSGLPFQEIVAIGTIIYETSSLYTNAIKARVISTDDGSDYVDFRKISSLPINQISDHGNLSGLSDLDHPASAIYTNTTAFSGLLSSSDSTIQLALDTLDDVTIADLSPLTTKGDLLTRDASAHIRLGVGSDGYYLTANSAQSSGLSWSRLSIDSNTNVSSIDINGSLNIAISTVTAASVTLDSTYHTVLADATSNSITINLPAAATCPRRRYEILKIDSSSNTVTIDANSTETISGSTTVVISIQYQSVTIHCNGTAWYII